MLRRALEFFRAGLGSNAVFLITMLGSLAGHVALIWLQTAPALEPQLPPREAGRTSIAVQLVAEPAPPERPKASAPPSTLPRPPEPLEPLPLERPEAGARPLTFPSPSQPVAPLPITRSPQDAAAHVEPQMKGWEAQAVAGQLPRERSPRAETSLPDPPMPPAESPPVARRSRPQRITLPDARVEVPETVTSQAATGSEVPPSFASRSLPPYPPDLLLQRIEGIVQLRVTVDRSGQVAAASVHRSSGYTEMDQSALDTVRTWTFVPARRGAAPIEKTVVVPIHFTIRRGN